MNQTQKNKSVPGNLSQTFTIAKYELLTYWRSKRFFLLLFIVAMMGTGGTLVVFYLDVALSLPNAAVFLKWWLDNSIWIVTALPAAFLGGDAISSEFQNKTAYSMIGNPVNRSTIYLGKWLATFVASLVLLATFEAITMGNGLYYFGNIPVEFWLSFLFSGLYLAASLGVAFVFSSVFKTSALPVLLSGATLLLGFDIVRNIILAMNMEPWFVLSYAQNVITKIFIVPYPENIVATEKLITYTPTIPQSILVMVAYTTASLLIGYLIFKNRDIT
jgi:ABC-2 type transport system permease protein